MVNVANEWGNQMKAVASVMVYPTGTSSYSTVYGLPHGTQLFALTEDQLATRQRIAKELHYPECWDTAAYPTLEEALLEALHTFECSAYLDGDDHCCKMKKDGE